MSGYFTLSTVLGVLLGFAVRRSIRTDILSAAHYGLLQVMAYQGLSSLVFAYAKIPLSFHSLTGAMLGGIVAITLFMAFTKMTSATAPLQEFRYGLDRSVAIAYGMSFLAAIAAAVIFFTWDLVPSSMTGDPARHFLYLIDLSHAGTAAAYKPIYYIWAGVFANLPLPLARDQIFVLFNVLMLGLLTSSSALLMIQIVGKQKWYRTLIFVSLIAFGYPFFALQYGYFTLMLSAVFLLSALTLMVDYVESGNLAVYALQTLLACGLFLTHSYFAPDYFLIVAAVTCWRCHHRKTSIWREIMVLGPFWLFAACILVLTNQALFFDPSGATFQNTILARGFVNEDFYINILFFGALSLPYFRGAGKSGRQPVLLLYILGVAFFSFVMYGLYIAEFSAAYYVNRNQLILLPLLIVGTIGSLQCGEGRFRMISSLVGGALLLMVIAPYAYYRNAPLALTSTRLLDLLAENGGFLYFINAEIASYSPLQFTARDRRLLTLSGRRCLHHVPERMAVLGTDHQVIWFGIYSNTYPSLVGRTDGFCDTRDYLFNYALWSKGDGGEYIAVIKHTNYLVPSSLLQSVKKNGELVCAGDSFAIYRRQH